MKVAWVIDALGRGGAEALVAQYAEAARFTGIELHVFALRASGGSANATLLRDNGIPLTWINSRNLRDLRAWRLLVAALEAAEVEFIHAHLTYATIWSALASWKLRVPMTASLHVMPGGKDSTWADRARERLMCALLRARAQKTVAVSEATARAYVERGLLRREGLEVVRNGVQLRAPATAAQRAEARAQFGIPEGARVLVSVALLREAKGIGDLLQAMPRVLRTHPRTIALIAGDGPDRQRLEAIANQLGLRDCCRFVGFLEDVSPVLRAADAFVHPSREEAMPGAVLEALAAAVPVVATAVGGTQEILTDGSGTLVPPRSPAALGEAIVAAFDDPQGTATTAQEGRARVAARFSVGQWAKDLADLYGRLASGCRPAPEQADRGIAAGLRVAVVEPVGRGGLIQYAFQLCRALAEQRLQVELITCRDWELANVPRTFEATTLFGESDVKRRPGQTGVRVRPFLRLRRAFSHYGRWLRLLGYVGLRRRYDVVQLGDIRFPFDVVPIVCLRLLGVRLTDICHNVEPFAVGGPRGGSFGFGSWSQPLLRLAYRQFSTVFVHYAVNRDRFLARYEVDRDRVVEIPHGNEAILEEVASGEGAGALRADLGIGVGDPVVLLPGTLSRYKGVDTLIEALPSLLDRFPDARVVIAGHPLPDFDLARHKSLAAALGVHDSVSWNTRYLEAQEIASWLQMAQLVALPYRQAYQSGVAHLAQTFGVPVVATRTGAFAQILEDTGSGLLVPPDDPPALAKALSGLLADDQLRREKARNATRAAHGPFAWSEVAGIVRRRYEELLADAIPPLTREGSS